MQMTDHGHDGPCADVGCTASDQTERSPDFEEWAKHHGFCIQLNDAGDYKFDNTHYAWRGWLARTNLPQASHERGKPDQATAERDRRPEAGAAERHDALLREALKQYENEPCSCPPSGEPVCCACYTRAALREQRDTPPQKNLTVGIDPNSVAPPSSVRVPTDGSSVPRCDYPNCAGSAWRCFHCRAEFDTDAEAEVHFGKTEVFTTPTPVCQLTLARVRQLDALAEEVAQTWDDCEERDPEFVITKDHYDNLCAAIEGLESARDASGSSDLEGA